MKIGHPKRQLLFQPSIFMGLLGSGRVCPTIRCVAWEFRKKNKKAMDGKWRIPKLTLTYTHRKKWCFLRTITTFEVEEPKDGLRMDKAGWTSSVIVHTQQGESLLFERESHETRYSALRYTFAIKERISWIYICI